MAEDQSVTGEQMSIGDFARRTRLPVSTLRYYHELGVLVPARVDDVTGYRRYDVCQVETAALVATLRRLGVPPAELTDLNEGSKTLEHVLVSHRDRLRGEIEERAKAIERIGALLDPPSPPQHRLVKLECRTPKRVPAAFGEIVTENAEWAIRRLAVTLRSAIRQEGHADPTWYGALLPLDLDTDPVPTAVFADAQLLESATAHRVDLPGGDYAMATHSASDQWLATTYRTVLDWVEAQGRSPSGAVIEEYMPDGATIVAVHLHAIER